MEEYDDENGGEEKDWGGSCDCKAGSVSDDKDGNSATVKRKRDEREVFQGQSDNGGRYNLSLKRKCNEKGSKAGRRSGEEGIGSMRYLGKYNVYVESFDAYIDDPSKLKVMKAWVDAAEEWVNQDVTVIVDDEIVNEPMPVKKKIKPVVPKSREGQKFEF